MLRPSVNEFNPNYFRLNLDKSTKMGSKNSDFKFLLLILTVEPY